jgi:hypothetical protein
VTIVAPTDNVRDVSITPTLQWNYTDPEENLQTKVQIVICKTDVDSSCELPGAQPGSKVFDKTFESGAYQYSIPPENELTFNTRYNWKVRATDDDILHPLTDMPFAGSCSSGRSCPPETLPTFTTIERLPPEPDFKIFPPGVINAKKPVEFIDKSKCYSEERRREQCPQVTWEICEQANVDMAQCPQDKKITCQRERQRCPEGKFIWTCDEREPKQCSEGPVVSFEPCPTAAECTYDTVQVIHDRGNNRDSEQRRERKVRIEKRIVPKIRTRTPFPEEE